jgi:serine/threonine protein kinase
MWIQFYEDPFAPKPGELERPRDYLIGLLGPPDPTPRDRMAGPLPAVGDIQNGIELHEEIAGAMFNSIHRGTSAHEKNGTRARLLTSAAGIAKGLDEWFRRDLRYTVEGVAECITAECFEGPSGPISVLVEVCPAGRPVAELAPMTEGDAVTYLRALADVVAAAQRQHRLVGIHPLTCYADDRGRLTQIAPRALSFLLALPPMRGGLCLADAYAPAEVWRGGLGSPSGDVFSLCALGLFLVTGRHPYPANGDPNRALAAVMNGAPPATPPNPLDAILRPGLDRDPDERPTIDELRARLA